MTLNRPKIRKVFLTGTWPKDIRGEVGHYFADKEIVIEILNPEFPRAMLSWAELGALTSALAASITVGLNIWDRINARLAESKDANGEEEIPLDEKEAERLLHLIKERGMFNVRVNRLSIDKDKFLFVTIYNESTDEFFRFRFTFDPDNQTMIENVK